MSKIYDVIIIGAGTAGLSAREEVAKKTGNYLIVDPGPYGTTCARVGCMPSKVLIEAASLLHAETHFKKLGAQRASAGTVDTRKLLRHVRRLRDTFVLGNVKNMVQWRKTHLLRASARFISNDEIRAGKKTYRAKRFIVATGSEPVIPSDWSAPKSKLLTTDTFFELKSLPKRMAVIGSGPIGLEMGQAIARIGTEVTLFGEAKSIGGLTDPQVVRNVVETLAKELTFKDEVVEDVERVGSRFRVRTKVDTYLVDQVLVAIGRKPNLAFLGLEQLDVTYDSSGKLQLDPNFTIPGSRIQLVGDVNDYRPILHESGYQGFKIGRSEAPTDRAALAIAFTSPNIATVGESLKDLRSRKFAFVVGTARLVDQGRALAKLANDGVIRLYAGKIEWAPPRCGTFLSRRRGTWRIYLPGAFTPA